MNRLKEWICRGIVGLTAVLSSHASNPAFNITLTSPTNNAVVQPGPVEIRAIVTNLTMVASQVIVEFRVNTILVDMVTNSTFNTFVAIGEWTATSGTNILLQARAISTAGNVAESQFVRVSVNERPTVTLTSPTNGQSFLMRDSILLSADASDTDGSVTNLQFFAGTNSIASGTNATFLWTNTIAGTQALTVQATDNAGSVSTSAVVSVAINTLPAVSITSPTNNTVLPSQGSVEIVATATDADGTVTNVQFFANGMLLGNDAIAPYMFTWPSVVASNYNLTALAVDNRGETNISGVVQLTVLNAAPTAIITSPPDGTALLVGEDLNVTIQAQDVDGMVNTVRVFAGMNELAAAAMTGSNLWTLDVVGLTLGNYLLTAHATDNHGSTSTSAPVRVDILNARLIEPTNNAAFLEGTDAPIEVELADGITTATVEIFQGTNRIDVLTSPPLNLLWTNVLEGEYTLQVRATNGLGMASTSAPVFVTVLTGPVVTPVTPAVSSRSGLLEQVIRLNNPTPSEMRSVRIIVLTIPDDLQIFNATGMTNGLPFVQYPLPIQPGETIDVTIEYYSPSRTAPAQLPTVMVISADPVPPPTITGTVQNTSKLIRLDNGRWLLEFNSLASRIYYVQFRTNMNAMTPWTTVLPSIRGSGDRVQWVDTGPPRTAPPPETAMERYYQIILTP